MDTATITKKYDRLFQAIRNVRHHQIRYYRFKTSVDLDKAKYYERQLDKLLKEEEKQKASQQQQLF